MSTCVPPHLLGPGLAGGDGWQQRGAETVLGPVEARLEDHLPLILLLLQSFPLLPALQTLQAVQTGRVCKRSRVEVTETQPWAQQQQQQHHF